MGISLALLIISSTLHAHVMCHQSLNYEGPVFTVEPDAMVQFSNSTGAVVPCGADGRPPPTVQWVSTDGQIVRDVPNLRRMRHDGSLTFLPFSAEDYRADIHATLYRCVAVNSVGSIYSRDVNVRAVVPQHFEIRLADEFVMRGNMAVLRCPLPSYVQDYVRVTAWERSDGFLIAPEAATGKYGMIGNGDLYLLDTNEHDSKDSFKCHTENFITKEKKTSSNYARVIVTEPLHNQLPRIIRRSDRNTIGLNERGTLYCLAQGYPPPGYRWLRQSGHRLTVPDFGASVRQEGGILIFHRAKSSDSGRYVCLVTNSVGEDRAESELEVIEPLKLSISPQLLKVEVGQSATLRCEVFGAQDAKISWRKDTQVLVPDLRNVLFPNSTVIRIQHIRREDAGMYQCFARLATDTAQATARIVIGDLAPTFRSVFTEKILRPGSYISLTCSVSGSPPPEVTWSLDGVWPVSNRPGLVVGSYVALDTGDVVSYVNISSVDVSDGGVYSCTALNEAGTSSHSARLNVYGPLTVRRMSGNVSALAGKSLNVICPFGGYPFQGVRWKKDGQLLPINQRQIVHMNGSLLVADVQRGEDDGHYSCEVTSRQGPSASGTFYVSVRTGPRVSPFKFEENLHEGMRTAVTCVVSAGDTPFTIRWSKDGVPLKDGVLGSAIHYPENGFVSTLSINKLAYRHNGKYTCLASNDVDTGSHTATLTVKVPPRWVLQPKDTSAVAGRPARIDCQADGVPQPHVRWKKASGHLPNDFKTIVSSSHVHILVNGSLNFQHVETADEGHYVCEANNGVGNGLNAVIRFVVHSAPQFYSNFAGLTTKRGQRTKIECVAKGEKPMMFTWRKNGEPLDTSQDSRYSVDSEETEEGETTRLVISKSERQDTALFTCVASNEYGQDTTNVQLTVRDIPDAPQNLEVHEASSRSVRLTWNRPFDGNTPITKYTVAWRQLSGQASGGPLSVAGGETTLTVRGLIPSTRYFFRVKCENELGQSQYGAEVAVTTLEEPPRIAPTLVQAVPVTSRSINVTWQIPIDQDGISNIEGFYVGYKSKNSQEPYTFVPSSVSLSSSQQHAIVHDLHRYTEYSIVVQAFNTRGAGPPSEEVIARTLEFDPPVSPVIKSHSVTSSTIKLLWELHDFPDSPVTGCILYHRTEDDDWHETHLTGQRTGYTLHGLKCGTTYLCYVVAFNSAGSSNASKIVSVKTEGNPPVAADKRSLLTTNSSSVLLHLRSFKDGGCPILTFIIWYKVTENRQDWVRYADEVHRDRRDVAIVGLRSGKWYTLRISARNDAGVTDAEYDFATLTLDGEFPPRPTELSGGNGTVYRHLTITLPVVGLAFLFVVILCSICLATRRRYLASRLRTPDEVETSGSSKPEQLPLSVTYEGAHDPSYFPAPYATGRIYQQGSYRGRDQSHRCPPSEKHPELDQFENHPATGRGGEIFCPQRQTENYTAPTYEKPVIYFPSYHHGALRARQEEAIYEVPDRGRMKQNSGNWRPNGDGNSSTESDNEEVQYTWHPPEIARDDARESETECDRLWKAYQESQYEGRKRWPDGHMILS